VLDGVPVERPNGTQKIFAKDNGVLVVGEALKERKKFEQAFRHNPKAVKTV
jgi:hypothetical protein